MLVLAGAPGTGKSALVGVARQLAEESGVRTLQAAGQESERDHPFALALQLFDPLLQTVSARERAKLLTGPAALAARLFSEGPASRLVEDLPSLLHGLFHLSARTADAKPTALLVDDAQFADEPSLRFLLHLGARIAGLPALIVAVDGHGGEQWARHQLSRLRGARVTTEIQLRPLSLTAVSAWARAESPMAPARAIHTASGGNPFLVGELLSEVQHAGSAVTSVGAVGEMAPRAVREWALRALQRIGPGARELAEVLALLGEDAELHHAAELAGLDERQATEVADGLIEAGMLRGEQRLSFAQPVVRHALLAGRPPSERGEAHREAARILRRDAAPPERVGEHLRRASHSGEEWVVEALLEAANAAGERGDPADAASHLRRALAEPARGDQRVRVLLELGRAEALGGEPQAVAHLTEAMDEITDPAKRAEVALEAGRTLYLRGLGVEATRVLAGAMAAAGESGGPVMLRARIALDTVSRLSAEEGATPRSAPGPEPAPASVERRLLLAQWAFEGGLRGSPREEVADLAHRALSGSRLVEFETADGVAIYLAAMALMFAEELGPAEHALSLALDDAQRRGSVLSAATAAYLRSLVRLRRGRLSEAEADARHAVSAQRFGWRIGLPGAYGVLSDLELESGAPSHAASQLAEGEDALTDVDHATRAAFLARRGNWRLATGDPPGALTDFLACGTAWTAVGARNPAVYPWRSRSALALAEMGDRDGARRLVEEELALARAVGGLGAEGRAMHALGLVAPQADRVEAFEQAVVCLERTEFSLDLAQALVDLGSALRRTRRPRDARGPLRRGLDLAGRCGAVQLLRRAEHELAAAGAKPRRQAVSGLEALTPREKQVALLAAQGLSNREIAESLVVTTKTVEWHIRHAFEKLSVRARHDLGAALEEDPGAKTSR